MNTHEARQFINNDSELLTILRQLPPIGSDGPWVAGGSVWKTIENMPLNCDVDFFFKSPEQSEQWFRQLLSMPYVHRIVSTPIANRYNTSLSYHIHSRGFNKTVKLQLISFAFTKDIEELLNSFDFTACQFAYDGQMLYSGDNSFEDLRNREIIFRNIRDNYSTSVHVEKYLRLGFKVPENLKQKWDVIRGVINNFSYNSAEPPRSSYVGSATLDDEYPRPENNLSNNNNRGVNLVQLTQMPPMPPARQERSIPTASSWWTSPNSILASDPVEYVPMEPTILSNNTSPSPQSVPVSSLYGTVTIEHDMEMPSSNPAGDASPGLVYANYIPTTVSPGISIRESD